MSETPSNSGKQLNPKTPNWGMSLFGWGSATAKKQRSMAVTTQGSTLPSVQVGKSFSPKRLPVVDNLTVADRQLHLSVGGGADETQVQPAATPPKATTAALVWAPQSTKRKRELTDTAHNSLFPEVKETKQSQWLPPRKKTRKRIQYRPRSATLKLTTYKKPEGIKVDQIHKALIAPRDMVSKESSQGELQKLRPGRTLNESHFRLLAHERKRTAAAFTLKDEEASLDFESSAVDSVKRKRVKFQQRQGTPYPDSVLNSPQSIASSQNSSIISGGTEHSTLRPATDEPFSCLLLNPGDQSQEEHSTMSLKSENSWAIQLTVPIARVRELGAKLIAPVEKDSTEVAKEEKVGKRPVDETPPTGPTKHGKWQCKECGHESANDESACINCGARRSSKPVSSTWGNIFDKYNKGTWKCSVCSTNVPDNLNKCSACEAPRPEQDGTTSAANTETNTKTPDPSNASKFKFSTALESKFKSNTGSVLNGDKKANGFGMANQAKSNGGFTFGTSSGLSEQKIEFSTKKDESTFGTVQGFTVGLNRNGESNTLDFLDKKHEAINPIESKTETPAQAGNKESNKRESSSGTNQKRSGALEVVASTISFEGKQVKPEVTGFTPVALSSPATKCAENVPTLGNPSFGAGSAGAPTPPGPSSGFAWPTQQNEVAKSSKSNVFSGGFGNAEGQDNPSNVSAVGSIAFGVAAGDTSKQENGDRLFSSITSQSGPKTTTSSFEGENANEKSLKKQRAEPVEKITAEPESGQPPVFKFGAKEAPNGQLNSSGPTSFTFGATAGTHPSKAPTPGPSFGASSFGGGSGGGSAPTAPANVSFDAQNQGGLFQFGSSKTSNQAIPFQFGNKPSHGTPATPAPLAPTFGQSTPGQSTTSQASLASAAAPSFGQAIASGEPAPTPAFGQSNVSTLPVTNFAFGASNTSSNAQVNTVPSGFAAANTPAPQSVTLGFGTTPSSIQSNGAWGNFGGSNVANPNTAQTFGAAPAAFGAAAPVAFGATAPAPFGGVPLPAQNASFGAAPVAGFGAPAASGGFSMGTGGTTTRRRILKAKRPK